LLASRCVKWVLEFLLCKDLVQNLKGAQITLLKPEDGKRLYLLRLK
jgi:hypothetical protein